MSLDKKLIPRFIRHLIFMRMEGSMYCDFGKWNTKERMIWNGFN